MSVSHQPDDLAGNAGGWTSGGCPAPPVRQIPPGSTPLRELLHAMVQALQLPSPATTKDELTYLRISRDRARAVMFACRRLLDNREADDADVMAAVTQLREEVGQLPSDQYRGHSLEF